MSASFWAAAASAGGGGGSDVGGGGSGGGGGGSGGGGSGSGGVGAAEALPDLSRQALLAAAGFTALAWAISGWHIRNHLLHNSSDALRLYVVRVLLMVPVYAGESLAGLCMPQYAVAFGVLREIYEAFVIYSFFRFLVTFLGGRQELADSLRDKEDVPHMFPFKFLPQWAMGAEFLRLTSVGILQYIPVKLLTSLIALLTSELGVYGAGEFRVKVAYPWLALVTNFSQMWAMYCLVLFYLGTREDLAPAKPVPKILCIKLIIFFTYWQSVGVAFLSSQTTLLETVQRRFSYWSGSQAAEGLQDLIICFEMLGFAIGHVLAFRVSDFDFEDGPGYRAGSARVFSNLIAAVNVVDVAKDVTEAGDEILTRKQELAWAFDQAG